MKMHNLEFDVGNTVAQRTTQHTLVGHGRSHTTLVNRVYPLVSQFIRENDSNWLYQLTRMTFVLNRFTPRTMTKWKLYEGNLSGLGRTFYLVYNLRGSGPQTHLF